MSAACDSLMYNSIYRCITDSYNSRTARSSYNIMNANIIVDANTRTIETPIFCIPKFIWHQINGDITIARDNLQDSVIKMPVTTEDYYMRYSTLITCLSHIHSCNPFLYKLQIKDNSIYYAARGIIFSTSSGSIKLDSIITCTESIDANPVDGSHKEFTLYIDSSIYNRDDASAKLLKKSYIESFMNCTLSFMDSRKVVITDINNDKFISFAKVRDAGDTNEKINDFLVEHIDEII